MIIAINAGAVILGTKTCNRDTYVSLQDNGEIDLYATLPMIGQGPEFNLKKLSDSIKFFKGIIYT